MSAKTHVIKKMLALLSISFCAMANASSFGINLNGDSQGGSNWNPRTGEGLVAVVSGETDKTIIYTSNTPIFPNYRHDERFIARAAAFGSDSSSGDGILNPRLKGYAIEPMAETQAYYHSACTEDGYSVGCANAWFNHSAAAWAMVDHRVVQRSVVLPEIKSILDSLKTIPVYVDFSLSTYLNKPDDLSINSSYKAIASFALTQEGNDLFSAEACSGLYCAGDENVAGRWATAIQPSTLDSIIPYTISAWSSVGMKLYDMQGVVQGQAIADPFLFVDPAWEYADYFVIQQESTLHPGEWVEVTRNWQDSAASVPEPGSLALLLTGIGLLSADYRRVKK